MAKLNPAIKENISHLPKKDLEKLVLKAARKDKAFHDFLLVNYFDREYGEQDLFEEAKADLQLLYKKNYKGYADELKMANMLTACNKRISEFGKVCKDKSLELDLIMEVLEIPFSNRDLSFRTCFTKYNYKVYLMVKKSITLLKNKLHKDYRIEYAPTINKYLKVLYRTSNHLDYIHNLPESI